MMLAVDIEGEGKPLVLLHGWGFDRRVWDPVRQLLSRSYTLYLVDLPGFGETQPMPWPSFCNALTRLVGKPFAVAGWSMGGLMATRLAMEHAPHVTHLYVLAASPRFLEDDGWPGVSPRVFSDFYNALQSNPSDTLAAFMRMQGVQDLPRTSIPSDEALRAGMEVLSEWDLRETLAKLQIPAAFVFGRLDAITPVAILHAMQERYPQFRYTLMRRAGHMPFLSHPEAFVADLEEFLACEPSL